MEPIVIPNPSFDSPLTEQIFKLERVRTELKISPRTESPLYEEMRELFRYLSSVMSARIEGNRTTLVEAIQGAFGQEEKPADEGVQEILNLEKASNFIDETVTADFQLTEYFIRQLHALTVDGLDREGDLTPGAYRTMPVRISQSRHIPPSPESIAADMQQLVEFINQDLPPQHHLMQVAIAHHRFVWIHPFGNRNGRLARLLTYAMMVKLGFTSMSGYRALNPTIVFGADRQGYYDNLGFADSLSEEGISAWCFYVFQGVEKDLEHILELSSQDAVLNKVYLPALQMVFEAGFLTVRDLAVLRRVAELGSAKAQDVADLIEGSSSTRSQYLAQLVKSGYLMRPEGTRRYSVKIWGNQLTIYIIRQLDILGMLPEILRD